MAPRFDEHRRPSSRDRVTQCRSCKAPIVWAFTDAAKKMPFDAAPADDGEWYFVEGKAVKISPGMNLGADVERYQTHFRTCPDADKWRGQRRYT